MPEILFILLSSIFNILKLCAKQTTRQLISGKDLIPLTFMLPVSFAAAHF
jgi:hypothetical protein